MLASHWSHSCLLQHGVIMTLRPRGSHHLLRTRFNTRATPSVTITQSLVVHLSHFGSVSHACMVWLYRLVRLVAYLFTLSDACSLSFNICKKVICCVVALGLTHLESNVIANRVMYNTITLMTVKLDSYLWKHLIWPRLPKGVMQPPEHNGLNINLGMLSIALFCWPSAGNLWCSACWTNACVKERCCWDCYKTCFVKVPASKMAAFDNLAIAFHKFHWETFVRLIQRQVGAMGLQISQISPQTNVLVLFLMSWQTNQQQGTRGAASFESLVCFDASLNKTHYWDTSNSEHVAQEARSTQAIIWKFMMMSK